VRLLAKRAAPRPRHELPPYVLFLLLPFFRFSDRRSAWVLRIVGERYGPVLRLRPAREGKRRGGLRTGAALLAAVALIVAAVLGFVLARSSSGSRSNSPQHVSAGPLSLTLPARWERQSAQEPAGLGLSDGIAAVSGDHSIVAGRATTTDPSLLPASILGAVGQAPAPQLVTLGGTTFYRYLNLTLSGEDGTQSIYAAPTAAGTVLALCRTLRAGANFASTCQQVVESIRLGSRTLGPGLSTTYATALSTAIGQLDAARATWRSRLLAAHTGADQAQAANQLRTADLQAAAAVGALSPGPASAANAALAAALRTEGQAYGALAGAAKRLNVKAYDAASAAVAHADTALSAALSRLGTFGYRVS